MIALLRQWWGAFVAGVLLVLGALLYRKGRTDVGAKVEIREIKHANEIHERTAAARSGAASRGADPDKLRESDGHRRAD